MENNKVVTRFAPSPTGFLHLGTYRTAIFAYLFARKHGGKFILRFEDTDKIRSKKEFEENILDSLKWMGMNYDEIYRDSELLDRHKFYLNKLIEEGKAYISKEEAKDKSGVIKEIVRFKNPNKLVSFHDEIKGLVTIDTTDLGDFVIARNINDPLFHFTVVVDDFEEGVTHIIRGEDHVSNTPRHILIQEAIGAPTPIYAHLPLVLGPDKQKLSKRKGALPISSYRELGYLPEAILNGVAFVGWNPGTEQEIFTLRELISAFDFKQVQKSQAVFNDEKLKWFNKEHIKLLDKATQEKMVKEYLPHDLKSHPTVFHKIFPIIIERIETFSDVRTMCESGEFDFVIKTPKIEKDMLLCDEKMRKGIEVNEDTIPHHLKNIIELITPIHTKDFNNDTVKNAVWDYATKNGRGLVLWAMRVALSGRKKSPDPFAISGIIGKEETILRLRACSESND